MATFCLKVLKRDGQGLLAVPTIDINGFKISIIVNAKKTTHVVLDTSHFLTSHTMTSVLDCAKLSFDHGFDGCCAATRGVNR